MAKMFSSLPNSILLTWLNDLRCNYYIVCLNWKASRWEGSISHVEDPQSPISFMKMGEGWIVVVTHQPLQGGDNAPDDLHVVYPLLLCFKSLHRLYILVTCCRLRRTPSITMVESCFNSLIVVYPFFFVLLPSSDQYMHFVSMEGTSTTC